MLCASSRGDTPGAADTNVRAVSIVPRLQSLYEWSAEELDEPRLLGLVRDGKGVAPRTALYLCEPASRFVTGTVLTVDGGWCVSEGQHPPGNS